MQYFDNFKLYKQNKPLKKIKVNTKNDFLEVKKSRHTRTHTSRIISRQRLWFLFYSC